MSSIESERALEFLRDLFQKHRKRLTTLQEYIFRETWNGKSYKNMLGEGLPPRQEGKSYDTQYFRSNGAILFQEINDVLNKESLLEKDEKVSKPNLKKIIEIVYENHNRPKTQPFQTSQTKST